jgi:signal transduction histidine kinase
LITGFADYNENNIHQDKLNQEMLDKFFDGSSIPAFVIDKEHNVIHWNIAMEALSGIKRYDVQGTDGHWRAFYRGKRPTLADFIVDNANDKVIDGFYSWRCKKSALIEGAFEVEDFFPEIGSKGKWIRITASPIRDNGRNIIGAIETLEDITQRKVAEENLRYHLKAITKAQEEERKRIARELHDDTVQLLSSLSRQLDTFIRRKPDFETSEITMLKGMLAQLNNGAQNVHRFSQELRLSVLDDLGLIPALTSLVKALQDGHGINADLEVIGEAHRYSPEVETMVFRIAQEAINNIGKHSQATKANINIEFTGETINLTVSDNGKGFNLPESIDALPRSGKLGLAGIKERASLLGGTIKVTSSPGKGTCLILEIPVE